MEWIEPVEVKSAVKYSSSLVSSSRARNERIITGSFPDLNVAWFATGDRLDVVSTIRSGVQSRHFQCPQGQDFEVTCVASIPNETLALVGLSSITGSGAVALYNYSTSLILSSWSVSHKVTSVCAIEVSDTSYRQFLKADCYLFALGTEEGHVMLLAIDQYFKMCEGSHKLDLDIVHYVTTDDILQKRAFIKPPVVLVIPLNDPMYRAGKFVLESMQENQAVLSVRQEEVRVSVIKYIPQNKSLCVGYNIQGAFQIFRLKTLDLDFSGFAQDCSGEQLNQILDFAFLEPEDDPRHYCYLTVVGEKSCGSVVAPFAVLYSLTYVQKDASPDGVILYEDLQYITLRLDLNFGSLILSGVDEDNDEKVKLISCRSLSSSFSSSTGNSTRGASCFGLCYFSLGWKGVMYLAIFDLNQWYQAQMPSRWIFSDMSSLCPFLGFYHTKIDGDVASQVWIQPNTLSIFHRSSTTPAEPFFFPSALSFRLVAVSTSEVHSVLFLGIQSLLLQRLSLAGSQALLQPHRFYVQAVRAGLAAVEVVAPNVMQMAEALLNIGLENNARGFLISCIKDEGANLNAVEKWAWQQVVNLKALRETLCHILFDHSTQEMEQQMHSQLYHVTHQFNNLAVLYDVMDKKIRALNSGVNDKLRDKSRAIYLLSLHLETVLWFLHGGLLPEADEGEMESGSLPYPRLQLDEFYRGRKSDIERLSSSIQSNEVLLIEQLIPSSVVQLWVEERGSNELSYPPPSLYALLSAYLRPDVDDVTKHRLVQYVFMDLAWIYGGRHSHYGNILQHLMTFPATYSLKPSIIKVTQAFWHLDHQNFDDALSVLLDPLVHAVDITNAQQRAILRSFLYQNQRRHALKYATLRHPVCPELEDIQLHLTILIANSLVADALSYVRRNKNQRNSEALTQHLLSGCREMRKFSVLLTLPLNEEEEEQVTSFLKQSRNIDLQEALLLFYIQRCKYPEAIAYSQRLNQMWPARDAQSRERFNRREMLMQTLIEALPPITCKLAAIANSRSTSASTGAKHPTPLSVAVLPATSKVEYSGSAFFRTVIEQSRATWLIEQKLHQEAQTPLKSRKRKLDRSLSSEEPEAGMDAESTPFLCNIVQPSKRNVTLGMSLCFPSPKFNATCAMDITEMGGGEISEPDASLPRQGKRPRFSLFPKSAAAVKPKTDAEVISVLQTPPVHRRRPSIINEAGSSCNRPSSILKDKMRRFMNFSTFEQGQPALGDSDSEADMEVSTTVVDAASSAKHLRFSLPTRSPRSSETEVPVSPSNKENDMEVVENTQNSFSAGPEENTNDETQKSFLFLSFEEDSEPLPSMPIEAVAPVAIDVQPTIEVQPTIAELATPAAEELSNAQEAPGIEAVDLDLNVSAESMELTSMTPAAVLTASHFVEEVDEPVESSLIALKEPEKAQQVVSAPDGGDSDESDIVCLDSSSESSQESEHDNTFEEEGEEEQFDEEDEQGEEEEVEEEQENESGEDLPLTHNLPTVDSGTSQAENDSEESEEAECFIPNLSIKANELPQQSTADSISGEEDEILDQENEIEMVSGLQEDLEVEQGEAENQGEPALIGIEEVADIESDEAQELDSLLSSDSEFQGSSIAATSMSTTNRSRFVMPQSDDDSLSNDELKLSDEMAAEIIRRTTIDHASAGYSKAESDFESEPEELPVMKQEDVVLEDEEPVAPLATSGYSQIESDFEDMEEEEGAEPSIQIRLAMETQLESSRFDTDSAAEDASGEEEEEEDEEADFNLELTDTPASNVSRRKSSRRSTHHSTLRRLELSDNDSSNESGGGSNQQQQDVGPQNEQSPERQAPTDERRNIRAPEVSPEKESEEAPSSDTEEEVSDPAEVSSSVVRRETITASSKSQRVRVFKSRLELSDVNDSLDSGDSTHQQEEQIEEQEPQQEQSPTAQVSKQETENVNESPEVSTERPKEDSSSDSDEDSDLKDASSSVVRRETITASSKSQQVSVFKSRLELSDNDSSMDSGDSIHQQQEQMEDQEPQEQQEPDLQDATQETDNTPEVSTGCPKEGSSSDSDEDPALRSIYQKETITASSKSQQFSVFKSRLELTASDSSSSEEEEEIEEVTKSSSSSESSSPASPATKDEEEPIAPTESGGDVDEIEAENSDDSDTEENKDLGGTPKQGEAEEEIAVSDASSHDVEPIEEEKSSDGSPNEAEHLKEILQRHQKFQLPGTEIIFGPPDLSVIMEERDSEHSLLGTTSSAFKAEESVMAQVQEEDEEEDMQEEPVVSEDVLTIDQQQEEVTEAKDIQIDEIGEGSSTAEHSVNPLEAAAVDENVFELAQSLIEEKEPDAGEKVPKKRGGRGKSLKPSQVPLPFSARRTTWDPDRSKSPDSVTSEPPQTFEEMAGVNTKSRRRHHSASTSVPTRRSVRLATSICEAPDENQEEVLPEINLTPPKVPRRRSAATASTSKEPTEPPSLPPSVEVSPSDSIHSGRSSAPGTPVRRSVRLSARRDQTPEPTASADLLMATINARIRRNSTGMGDISAQISSPRRSGRRSVNASRDNSPDSVTSEPPPRTENTTPSRKKPTRTLKSGQKSKTRNLFPLEEESETTAVPATAAADSADNASSEEELEVEIDTSVTKRRVGRPRGSGQSSARPVSVNSSASPSSSRYNLRRTRQTSELDIISEEDAAAAAATAAAAAAAQQTDSSSKRPRDDGSAEGESSDQTAGPSFEDKSSKAKRSTRPKRQKKEDTEDSEELHFALAPRPPPKGVPKREPVINKSTRSKTRKVLHLSD